MNYQRKKQNIWFSLLLIGLCLLIFTACGTRNTVESTGKIVTRPATESTIESTAATMEPTEGIVLIETETTSEHSEDSTIETTIEVPVSEAPESETEPVLLVEEDGQYFSKDEVALYIHLYGHLPSNYVTKKEAQSKGWEGGSLEKYFPGCAIGGDKFGNYEELLPKADGRTYKECDIDTVGKSSRGAKRIVFSNDGLVYYTEDHYEHFELLYGTP